MPSTRVKFGEGDSVPVSSDVTARRSELRDFLVQKRMRLHPRDVGLSTYGRRVSSGLRRSDVAELAGVSTRWYETFESGTSDRRFSLEFVDRLTGVLRLDERERATLFRLALPEFATAIEVFEQSARDGALESIRSIRDFARRAHDATSFEEAACAGIEAVQSIVQPDCFTAAIFERERAIPEVIAVGPRAERVDAVLAKTVLDMNAPAREGATILCEEAPDPFKVQTDTSHPIQIRNSHGHVTRGVHRPDLYGYRDYNGRVRQRSNLTVGMFERERFRGDITCFWVEPRQHSPTDIHVMETVGAILELMATR